MQSQTHNNNLREEPSSKLGFLDEEIGESSLARHRRLGFTPNTNDHTHSHAGGWLYSHYTDKVKEAKAKHMALSDELQLLEDTTAAGW